MNETPIADFTGRCVVAPSRGHEDPEPCRIVMSHQRLVVAVGADDRWSIPLSTVVDVMVGSVPDGLEDVFDHTVRIGFESSGGEVDSVLLESEEAAMQRFVTMLFTCLLNDEEVGVRHPALVGGRLMESAESTGRLSITDEGVGVVASDGEVEIRLESVIDFEVVSWPSAVSDGATVLVRQLVDGEVVTTLISPASARGVKLVGRYLRLVYSTRCSDVHELSLEREELRVLNAMYTVDGVDGISQIDGIESDAATAASKLQEKGLVESDGSGVRLTTAGFVVVYKRQGVIAE